MPRANARLFLGVLLAASVLLRPLPAAPPVCTTHFFDWYVINGQAALDERQKQWTYRVDWGALGITPEEIGTSVHYYEAQFRKISALPTPKAKSAGRPSSRIGPPAPALAACPTPRHDTALVRPPKAGSVSRG
jgi:hypothetical protein